MIGLADLGPLLKAAAVVASLAALVFVVSNGIKSVYKAGDANGAARVQRILDGAKAEAERDRAAHQAKVDQLTALLSTQEADAARKLAAAVQRAGAVRIKVQEVIRANPEFAAVERPADLRRLRDDDFTELERAASEGASLSGASLPGLPTTSEGHGPDDGVGRDRGPGEPTSLAALHDLPQ